MKIFLTNCKRKTIIVPVSLIKKKKKKKKKKNVKGFHFIGRQTNPPKSFIFRNLKKKTKKKIQQTAAHQS